MSTNPPIGAMGIVWPPNNNSIYASSAPTNHLSYGTTINEYSTDGTMSGNSDDAVPTEQAVVTYVSGIMLNDRTLTVNPAAAVSSTNFHTLQAALDSLHNVSYGATTITISPGIYDETDIEAISFASENSSVTIIGDVDAITGITRDCVGRTYVTTPASTVSNLDGLANDGGQLEVVTVTAGALDFTVTCGGGPHPDFAALGVVNGDRLLVIDGAGAASIMNVTGAAANVISLSAAPPAMGNGAGFVVLPNVCFEPTGLAPNNHSIFIAKSPVTIKGVGFGFPALNSGENCLMVNTSCKATLEGVVCYGASNGGTGILAMPSASIERTIYNRIVTSVYNGYGISAYDSKVDAYYFSIFASQILALTLYKSYLRTSYTQIQSAVNSGIYIEFGFLHSDSSLVCQCIGAPQLGESGIYMDYSSQMTVTGLFIVGNSDAQYPYYAIDMRHGCSLFVDNQSSEDTVIEGDTAAIYLYKQSEVRLATGPGLVDHVIGQTNAVVMTYDPKFISYSEIELDAIGNNVFLMERGAVTQLLGPATLTSTGAETVILNNSEISSNKDYLVTFASGPTSNIYGEGSKVNLAYVNMVCDTDTNISLNNSFIQIGNYGTSSALDGADRTIFGGQNNVILCLKCNIGHVSPVGNVSRTTNNIIIMEDCNVVMADLETYIFGIANNDITVRNTPFDKAGAVNVVSLLYDASQNLEIVNNSIKMLASPMMNAQIEGTTALHRMNKFSYIQDTTDETVSLGLIGSVPWTGGSPRAYYDLSCDNSFSSIKIRGLATACQGWSFVFVGGGGGGAENPAGQICFYLPPTFIHLRNVTIEFVSDVNSGGNLEVGLGTDPVGIGAIPLAGTEINILDRAAAPVVAGTVYKYVETTVPWYNVDAAPGGVNWPVYLNLYDSNAPGGGQTMIIKVDIFIEATVMA